VKGPFAPGSRVNQRLHSICARCSYLIYFLSSHTFQRGGGSQSFASFLLVPLIFLRDSLLERKGVAITNGAA
jgi:hypothetical protein